MKVCRKCKIEKDESEFYGYHICKECKKSYQREREKILRETNTEWIDKERLRGVKKYHRLNYRLTNKQPYEKKKVIMERYIKRYPEKYAAHNAIVMMDRREGYHLHHWSYNEPDFKSVIELQSRDHAKIHRYLKYDPINKIYKTLEGEPLDSREKHQLYIDSLLQLPF